MKKLLALVLCLLLTVQILPVGFFTFEASAETEGYYIYTVTDGKATITNVSTSISGVVTIPSTLGGYPVTSIGDNAFYYCSSLTSITIPDGVTSIGSYAFYNCSSLTSITIPNSVTSIGSWAFASCYSLTSITIPDGVTSIGSYAFRNCSKLTSITIPDSVTSIGNGAFDGCSGLTSVTYNAVNCTTMGSWDSPAFSGCTNLTTVVIGNQVQKIPAYAFKNCSSLTSITIGDSVTSIGSYAFHNCDSLTSITIPDSVTSIGSSAFYNCTSLTSITIPNSVTSIDYGAFAYCSSLTSITIPDSVTSISNSAFYNCSSLTKVYYTGSAAQRGQISIGSSNTALTGAEWHYTESHDSCEGNHYDGVCDETCNVCAATRMAHVYDNACDADCNVCGDVCTPDVHRVEGGVVTFTNATNYPFKLVDGVYQSSNKVHSSTATATLNALHSGKVTIQYYTSSEQNYDKLIIKQNGTAKATVSGSTSWITLTLTVAAGDSITVSYTKDGSESSGNDTVYFKFSGLISAADAEPTCEDAVICSVCGFTVKQALGHRYDNDCDTACNTCGDTRTVGDHLYDNDCDTDCNECGKERTVPDHNYEWIVDEQATCGVNGSKHEQCSICYVTRSQGTVIPATGAHTYDNDQDTTCNVCGDVREVVDDSAATLTVQGATVMAGKQVLLQVLLAGNTGFTYLELTPTYPADWTLEAQNGALVADLTQGKQLVWVADENMTDDGLLVTLVFTVPEDTAVGEYDIGFTVRGCYNYDEQAVALRVVSGTVTVQGDAPSFEDVSPLMAQLQNGVTAASEKASIRFVAAIEDRLSDFDQVGFVLSLSNHDPTVGGDKCTVKGTSTVYTAILANGVTIPASKLGGSYIFALSLNNIPNASFGTDIYVRAYVLKKDGSYSYSAVKSYNVSELLGGAV